MQVNTLKNIYFYSFLIILLIISIFINSQTKPIMGNWCNVIFKSFYDVDIKKFNIVVFVFAFYINNVKFKNTLD